LSKLLGTHHMTRTLTTTYMSIGFVVAFACGCNQANNDEYANFQNIATIDRLDTFKIPPVLLKENWLVATDDYLISLGADKDKIFKVFDRSTMKYLGGFGKTGGGPEEFEMVNSSGTHAMNNNHMTITDLKYVREVSIDFDPSTGIQVRILKKDKIPGYYIPFNSAFILNDSVIMGVPYNAPEIKELSFVNTHTNISGAISDYPNLYPNIPAGALKSLYFRVPRLSWDKSKIFTIYRRFPMLKIYDVKTNTSNLRFYNVGNRQKKIIDPTPNGRDIFGDGLYFYYTTRISLSRNKIYAPYKHRQVENQGSTDLSKNEIHIFDLEGNPIKRLIVQEWMLWFAVSPDDKYIYFWHPDIEDELFRYNLDL